MITARLDRPEAIRILGRLGHRLDAFPGQLIKTLNVTINAVATKTKSHAVKILTGRYAIKAGKIRDKIKVKRSKGDYLSATVEGSGKQVLLDNFDYREVNVGRYRGVKVRVLKSSSRKLLTGGAGGAFMAFGRNIETDEVMDRRFIFERQGKARYKLRIMYGPSLVGWFMDPANMAVLQAFAESQLVGTLTGVANAHLKKLGMSL